MSGASKYEVTITFAQARELARAAGLQDGRGGRVGADGKRVVGMGWFKDKIAEGKIRDLGMGGPGRYGRMVLADVQHEVALALQVQKAREATEAAQRVLALQKKASKPVAPPAEPVEAFPVKLIDRVVTPRLDELCERTERIEAMLRSLVAELGGVAAK